MTFHGSRPMFSWILHDPDDHGSTHWRRLEVFITHPIPPPPVSSPPISPGASRHFTHHVTHTLHLLYLLHRRRFPFVPWLAGEFLQRHERKSWRCHLGELLTGEDKGGTTLPREAKQSGGASLSGARYWFIECEPPRGKIIHENPGWRSRATAFLFELSGLKSVNFPAPFANNCSFWYILIADICKVIWFS